MGVIVLGWVYCSGAEAAMGWYTGAVDFGPDTLIFQLENVHLGALRQVPLRGQAPSGGSEIAKIILF